MSSQFEARPPRYRLPDPTSAWSGATRVLTRSTDDPDFRERPFMGFGYEPPEDDEVLRWEGDDG